jgi:hypothetical protein
MSSLSDRVRSITDARFGFHVDEVMTGTHQFEPGFGAPGQHPMEFRVTWGTDDARTWFDPSSDKFMVNELHGTVTIDGLCHEAPCTGSLELRYFTERSIRYTFEFEANGICHRYVGEKVNIWPWNVLWTHTTCYGRTIEVDSGKLVSTAVLYFRLRTMPGFVGSLRFMHAAHKAAEQAAEKSAD